MRKNYCFIYIHLCLLISCGSVLHAQNKIIPYQQLPTSTGSLTGSNMYFGATMTTSSITITFQGPADRWIAFGFGPTMTPADVFIYSSGRASAPNPLGWEDYYNDPSTSTIVDMDASQDWNVISTASLSTGQRTVTASRALNTGDSYDVTLNYIDDTLKLIWARGATADYTIAYHGGTNRQYGIDLPWLSQPTASFAVSSLTACQGSALTFSNLSTGGLTSYTWSFASGNPATSTSTNATVSYTAPGTYSVSLIALNAIGSDTLRQINYITVTPTVAAVVSAALASGSNPICEGAPLTFSASSVNGGSAPIYQWQVNGINAGGNSASFTGSLASLPSGTMQVVCKMTTNLGCALPTVAVSPPITMTVNSAAAASVSVVLTSGVNPICIGSIATYSAIAGNGGANPFFQWQVNGANAGTNSLTFTTSALANGDVVTCQLGSSSSCASATFASSAAITMSVSSFLVPSVSVAIASGSNPLCGSATINAIANAINEGNTPTYQWLINGVNAGSANSPSFAAAINSNGTVLVCLLTSGLSCANPATVTSNPITFTVNPVPPTPVISASGPLGFCGGGSVVLTSSGQYAATWSNGASTHSILVTNSGSFSVSQSDNGCYSLASAVSSVTVYALPVVSMQTLTPICLSSGTFVLIQGSPTGGTYSGSNVNGLIFSPGQNGPGSFETNYTYTDGHGCSRTASISTLVDACLSIEQLTDDPTVTVFPNPVVDEITIRSVKLKIISASIMDMSGRIIFKKTGDQQKELLLNISNEAAGLYTLGVVTAHGTIYYKISKRD